MSTKNKPITPLDVEGIMLKTFEDTVRFFEVFIRGLKSCKRIEKDPRVKEGIQVSIDRAETFVSRGFEAYELVRARKFDEINSICQIEELHHKVGSGNKSSGN